MQADVFGLSNFLAAAILWAVAINFKRRSLAASMLTAFICGLSLTNQHTCIFLVFPVALAVLVAGDTWTAGLSGARRLLLGFWRLLVLLSCGVVGLLPYLYLPIAARADALVSWGDCATLKGFIRHMTRAEYGAELWCPVGGDTYCLSLQLFANQRRGPDFLSASLLSVSRSGAAWATSVQAESSYMMLPLVAVALAAHAPALVPAASRKQPNSSACSEGGAAGGRGLLVDAVVFSALAIYLVVFHALASIPAEVGVMSHRHMLVTDRNIHVTLQVISIRQFMSHRNVNVT